MGRTVMRDLIHHDESMSLSHRIEDKNTTTSFRATATVVIDDREHSPTNRTQITVGRPGLDPCTLGSKGTFKRLPCDGLVANVDCFRGIVLSCVDLGGRRIIKKNTTIRPLL